VKSQIGTAVPRALLVPFSGPLPSSPCSGLRDAHDLRRNDRPPFVRQRASPDGRGLGERRQETDSTGKPQISDATFTQALTESIIKSQTFRRSFRAAGRTTCSPSRSSGCNSLVRPFVHVGLEAG